MPSTSCGFDDVGGGNSGSELLVMRGPTLLVDIGFDPQYQSSASRLPLAGLKGLQALIDTGATESCIDSRLASQLNLPIVDRLPASGVHGSEEVNIHLAQIYVPSLRQVMHGSFAGVHLVAGGQTHWALLGRTFLRGFRMIYDGRTGAVTIED